MSTAYPRIEHLLIELKADGRSSPKGWHRFYLFLKAKKHTGEKDPPVPLILAASGESSANKHRVLAEQLQWAVENGCLDEAIRYLRDIPPEGWDSSPLERWNQEHYPKPDGTYGPTYLKWSFDPKPKTSAERAAEVIETLRAHWDEIAGPELARITFPLRLSGAKGRRLVVLVRSDAIPPWGSWIALDDGPNRRYFTRFRRAVNAAAQPVEVDHIDFVHESTKQSR